MIQWKRWDTCVDKQHETKKTQKQDRILWTLADKKLFSVWGNCKDVPSYFWARTIEDKYNGGGKR